MCTYLDSESEDTTMFFCSSLLCRRMKKLLEKGQDLVQTDCKDRIGPPWEVEDPEIHRILRQVL